MLPTKDNLEYKHTEWVKVIGWKKIYRIKVKSESEVTQSCPTLCDPMDCSLPGFSRQECWSGVPLPSPKSEGRAKQNSLDTMEISMGIKSPLCKLTIKAKKLNIYPVTLNFRERKLYFKYLWQMRTGRSIHQKYQLISADKMTYQKLAICKSNEVIDSDQGNGDGQGGLACSDSWGHKEQDTTE